MNTAALTLRDITDLEDPHFFDWLDLYETAFPPSEKLLVSTLLKILRRISSGEETALHMSVLQDTSTSFMGMMVYEARPEDEIATLWYFAIKPSERNKGLGTIAYQALLKHLDPAVYRAMVFEVEIPSEENAEEARRRIAFYRRQGALMLEGIEYWQHIGWHHPPTLMHIMVHPIQPLNPEQAFALAQRALGDAVQPQDELRLR